MSKPSPRARIRNLASIQTSLQRAHTQAMNAEELETASDILEVMQTVAKRADGIRRAMAPAKKRKKK